MKARFRGFFSISKITSTIVEIFKKQYIYMEVYYWKLPNMLLDKYCF